MIIDRFAGPGGWDEGLRLLGRTDVIGIEWDSAACETARANGHLRVQGDVATIDPHEFVAEHLGGEAPEGGIDSPPCQGFSPAGLRLGLGDTRAILTAVEMIGAGLDVATVLASLRERCADPRSALVLEPLRWALALRPEWLAWEQVPAVLPLWEACADVLRAHGYSAWTATLRAEQYGVPQTRRRACLGASRVRDVAPPVPTYSRYYERDPSRLDEGVLPWVSMAEALSVSGGWSLRSNYGSGGDPKNRGVRTALQPAPTVTSKIGRNKWQMATAGATARYTAGQVPRDLGKPSATLTGKGTAYWTPTELDGKHSAETSIRVTVAEAAVLQSFPSDYVWRGTQGKQFQQVGNAVPPLLAAAILRSVGAAS